MRIQIWILIICSFALAFSSKVKFSHSALVIGSKIYLGTVHRYKKFFFKARDQVHFFVNVLATGSESPEFRIESHIRTKSKLVFFVMLLRLLACNEVEHNISVNELNLGKNQPRETGSVSLVILETA
jgi:hypothetical protein